jgi:branched-chain amino acid transport system ATP-binding protein
MSEPLLEVEDISVSYGAVAALRGISLTVGDGEIVTLLGANGAGKTTSLRSISALLALTKGEVRFRGQRIDRMPPHKVVALGIGHVPEGRRVFPRMSIMENLEIGAYLDKRNFTTDSERVFSLFPVLAERRKQQAGTLSGGEQQMLAMGRALMSRPKLLMLDEPSMGLSPIMMQKIMATIAELRDQGTTILLVEQNAQAALSLADTGHVMEVGKIVLSGPGRELLTDDSVRKAYLGED